MFGRLSERLQARRENGGQKNFLRGVITSWLAQKTWLRLLAHLFLLLGALSSSALSENARRLWSVDLSKDQDFQGRLRTPEVVLDPPTVEFLNDKQVIVSFEDDDPWNPDPERKPFGFHVLEVEAHSGVLGRKLSLEVLTVSQARRRQTTLFLCWLASN